MNSYGRTSGWVALVVAAGGLALAPAARAAGGGALSGKRIMLSAGHGIVFSGADASGAWGWQRGIHEELREDIHTAQIVNEFLVPMIERAGGTVLTCRERHFRTPELLLDNDDPAVYEEIGAWAEGGATGFGGGTYRFAYADPDGTAEAHWTFALPATGDYPIYVYFLASANRSHEALFRVEHFAGVTEVPLDQGELRVQSWLPAGVHISHDPPPADHPGEMNARWHYLGTFPFRAGEPGAVVLSNEGDDPDSVVIADAIRVGADASGVEPFGVASGRPRWEESALANLEAMAVPGWVLDNDVDARALHAIYERADAFLSFHTNAYNGNARGTSTYTWYPEMWVAAGYWPDGWAAANLPPGTFEWAQAIQTSIVDAVRATRDPDWQNDGQVGANFGELRAMRYAWLNDVDAGLAAPTTIPAALIESAFHDNVTDTSHIRELPWRRVVARAVLGGMIRYFTGDPDALVPPLPPEAVAAEPVPEGVRVRWLPAPDPAEAHAQAETYRLYRSPDGVVFQTTPDIETAELEAVLETEPCESLFVRLTAVNAAGESMASNAAGARGGAAGGVRALWVNGVDREVRSVGDPNNLRDYARIYGPGLADAWGGAGVFATATDDAVVAGLVTLADFEAVMWSVGETSNRDGTFSADDRAVLYDYLASEEHPRLAVSGAEIGWDLLDYPDSTSTGFMAEVMHVDYVSDDSEANEVVAPAGSPLEDVGVFAFGTCLEGEDDACIEWPDVFAPLAGGAVVLEYAGGAGAAGISWEGDGQRVASFGFPLETVADPAQRLALVGAVAEMLLAGEETPDLVCEPPFHPDPGPEPGAEAAAEGVDPAAEPGVGEVSAEDRGPERPEPGPKADADTGREVEASSALVGTAGLVSTASRLTIRERRSGCGATGGHGSTAAAGLAIVLAWLALTRRRRAAVEGHPTHGPGGRASCSRGA